MPAAIESINFGFLLDGKWKDDGERIEILSPGTRQRVGLTYQATAPDAETAIRAAARAFEVTRKMGGFERQRILRAISAELRKTAKSLLAWSRWKPANPSKQRASKWIAQSLRSASPPKRPCESAVNICRLIGSLHRGPMGNCPALSTRPHRCDHAI